MKVGTKTKRDQVKFTLFSGGLLMIKSKTKFKIPTANRIKAAMFIPFCLTINDAITTPTDRNRTRAMIGNARI